MTAPSAKPYFRCPVAIKHTPNGGIEIHATRRDGTVEVIPAPPGMTTITSNVEAFQRAGSDAVEIVLAGH
jgi:hypothetical protein